jgi:serine/threonine-protein kinase RsbT
MGPLGPDAGFTCSIERKSDVERAVRDGRPVAEAALGSKTADRAVLVISELATNLLRYARGGQLSVRSVSDDDRAGLEILAWDTGPGIPDQAKAMRDGYSTGGGMGSGLPSVKRLTEVFDLQSTPKGTVVTTRIWQPKSR